MAEQNRAEALQVVDPILTNLARRYESRGFIAEQLAPSIPVQTLTGKYPVFEKQYWFSAAEDLKSSDRSPAVELDFEWSTESYRCERYAAKVSTTAVERQQAHPGLRFESSKVDRLMKGLAIAREHRMATLLTDSGTTGGALTAGTAAPNEEWNTATATIEDDLKTGALAIYDEIGYPPNTLVIPYKVAYAMAVQEDIRAILAAQITGDGRNFLELGSRVLPAVIHGMRVIVPQGVVSTTSQEGASSPTYSEIWSDDVRLLYTEPGASWGTPSVAYRFTYKPVTVSRYRTNDPDIDYVLAEEWVDEKAVAPDAGYTITSVLTAE